MLGMLRVSYVLRIDLNAFLTTVQDAGHPPHTAA